MGLLSGGVGLLPGAMREVVHGRAHAACVHCVRGQRDAAAPDHTQVQCAAALCRWPQRLP